MLGRGERVARSKLAQEFLFFRSMGGGPRTFPGGLNKWQWKRLHEKKAREKEKKLLQQEKQLYQARIRSHIRAKLAGGSWLSEARSSNSKDESSFSPITPEGQLQALADRFMKEGAEDLWNEDDGPLTTPPQSTRIRSPVRHHAPARLLSVRDPVSSGRHLDNQLSNTHRHYSSRSGSDVNGLVAFFHSTMEHSRHARENTLCSYHFSHHIPRSKLSANLNTYKYLSVETDGNSRFRSRFGFSRSSSGDDEGESSSLSGGGSEEEHDSTRTVAVKKIMSSAALGNYDQKREKRVHRRVSDRNAFSEEVQLIREEARTCCARGSNDAHIEEGQQLFSEKRFDECNISPLTIKALTSAGYIKMTNVQEATLSVCLEGRDVLVKAKSGTGKSIAFLLPAVETVLKAASCSVNEQIRSVLVLILCPTRELASQIAAETRVLLKYHSGIGVQTLTGGTRLKDDLKRLELDPCQIIVGTPGRLFDHIEKRCGFSVRLMGLKMLILDEADHLLDLGFRKDVEKMVDCVPRQRQTLLFSATVPKEVRRISQLVLRKDHAYIDVVGSGSMDTLDRVLQSYLVAPHDDHFHIVHHLLREHIARVADYKVIVFCTTSMMTSFLYHLLHEMKLNVRELHSRKPQIYRTQISDEFRESRRLVLVTSDISTRGVNYPDVTLVIQVGIPTDRGQYIHRLGRTGRGGKDGECILLLAPWEEYFLDEVKDLPIQKCSSPSFKCELKTMVEEAILKIDRNVKEAAYHAWLGYYSSIREIGRDKTMLIELANRFCESVGLERPPPLFRKTLNKLGLRNIPGIKIRR